MKKIVFFPYHPDLRTIIDHRYVMKDYQLAGFISFKEDKNMIHQLNHILELEDASYDQLLHSCDAVIILDNYRDFKTDKYYQVIEDAISQQKDVYITPLAQTQLDLKSYLGKYQLLECLPDNTESIEETVNQNKHSVENKIYELDVPVIGVLGQGKHCDKFENQVLLKAVLEEEYETTVVTTNALGALFGCFTIPSYIYENHSFEQKVLYFNRYIYEISKLGNPDVMVLGIPEGIAPFERQEFHHFAEYPLIATSAVSIDMAFLCTYFMRGSRLEYGLKKMAEFCLNKFNIPINAFAISRTAFEVPYEEDEAIVFEHLDESYLSKYYPDLKCINLPMINMLNCEEAKNTIKKSLKRLQENVSAI